MLCATLCMCMVGALAKPGAGSGRAEKLAHQFRMPLNAAQQALDLYTGIGLAEHGLEKEIFFQAYKGYMVMLQRKQLSNRKILSIADFSQSNRNKRLYIIDLRRKTLLVQTYVSHGKNTGSEMALSFSNVNNSNKSVLGFLITGQTYMGSNGLSLKFRGMERGINDMVGPRAIVVHGSKFVNERELRARGEMVNSLGCPAVPMAQSRQIINLIRGGSLYFIYHPDETYARRSPVLNARLAEPEPVLVTNAMEQGVTASPTPAGGRLQ